MFKRFTLIFIFLLNCCISNPLWAQWHQLPDTNFRSFLAANFVTAVQGDSINGADTIVNTLEWLDIDSLGIHDLEGIQAFQHLKHFSAKLNSLQSVNTLQQLPLLESIYLQNNPLDSLPDFSLFQHLRILDLNSCGLTIFPILPDSIEVLQLSGNGLDSFPDLSSFLFLEKLHIASNDSIHHLPALPPAISDLDLSYTNVLPSDLDTLQFFQLTRLSIAGLGLSQLPNGISGLPSLIDLNCSNNPIGNISVFPPNLLFLQMSGTQATSLMNLPNLIRLVCTNNNITNISFLPSTLQFFYAGGNPGLNQLPSSLPQGLMVMEVGNCNFQSLPAFPNALQKVFLQNNQLTCLPYLPAGLQTLLASGNNIHCLPNLLTSNFITDVPLISCAAWNPNNCPSSGLVQGRIFYDQNANALRDSGEPFLPNAMLSNGNGYFSLSNDSGYYQATPPQGLNTFCSNLPYQTNNNCVPVNISSAISNINLDFPVELLPSQNDLMLQASNCISPRPYHEMDLKVMVKNKGSVISASTTLKIVPDSYLSILSASLPYTTLGDTLVFYMDTLQIGEQRLINLWFDVSISAPMGHIIDMPLWIQNTFFDVAPSDNYFLFNAEVVNSYDPNDKRVSPDGSVEQDFVTYNDSLTYTIRFQNTGNAPAIHIFITDTLNALLDASTFHFIGSSHPCSSVLENQILTFYFNNINLPDSVNDEPNSHGFVRFSIKFVPTTTWFDTVRNQANIFFDYNPPILTNNTLNFIARDDFPTTAEANEYRGFSVFPMPADQLLNIIQPLYGQFTRFAIFSLEGRLILNGPLSGSSTNLDVSQLPAGAYNLNLTDARGNSEFRKLLIIHESK
jgi:uncharacterized repeat protein (TIGR01451 family)